MPVFQRLRSGGNPFIFIAGVLLTVFLLLLIAVVFLGQAQLKQVAQQRAVSELENQAAALHYFIAEQKDALQELASGRVINSYLANQAPGMAMEYGLRASLLKGSLHDQGNRLVLRDVDGMVPVSKGEHPENRWG